MFKILKNWGIIWFFVFVILSILVYLNAFTQIDFIGTVKTQAFLGNSPVEFFSLFSLLGTVEFVSLILLILLILTIKMKRIYVLALYVLTGIIEILGKTIISQNGPPISFLKTEKLLSVPSDLIPHEFFSYPSGHASRTAFVSGILILIILISKRLSLLQKRIAIAGVLIFDFLMFLSRVYLGEHWVSDVAGGALLGFSLAFFASQFLNFKKPSKAS